MKHYKVRLTFQCSEDWNKMIPNNAGRHCLTCNKTVIDFSTMSDRDIIQYLLKNKNTCGRFQKTQLNRSLIIYNYQRKSNWPAIAAMLIAGLIPVAPSGLMAASNKKVNYTYNPVEGEKNTKNVEPDKNGNFEYTIRLFNKANNTQILWGSAYINNLGTFASDINGDIKIKINNQDIPEIITIAISTSGYGYHEYTITKKDLKNSTGADLYFDEVQMPAGMVSIQDMGEVKIEKNK